MQLDKMFELEEQYKAALAAATNNTMLGGARECAAGWAEVERVQDLIEAAGYANPGELLDQCEYWRGFGGKK